MHRIEFFTYPSNAPATGSPLVGIRVDGTDLRTYTADATFGLRLREREAEEGDGDDAEDPDFARPQHNGLPLEELGDLARHFHGDPLAEFADMGATPVLGCPCGVWACWPLLAVISLAPDTVTWSGFRQPYREEWGELPMGPYVFPAPRTMPPSQRRCGARRTPWATSATRRKRVARARRTTSRWRTTGRPGPLVEVVEVIGEVVEEVVVVVRSSHPTGSPPYCWMMRAPHIDRPADLDTVRQSYDRVADNYAHMVLTTGMGDIRRHPWLQAAIDAFADTVGDLGPVLDVGCGPGTVTAYLAERGLDVSGVDLSPRMIENARRLHPECRFRVASATELDLPEASFGGLLGWWSLFNLPRDVLPQVLAQFACALKPGGHFITGTHVGDEDTVRTEAYGGVPVRWTTYKWQPEQLVALIEQAGLRPVAELRLPPDEHTGPSVVVMAQRPA
ncbi:SAM-dependent methyltransferase [Streptomyces candidus]|uniref:SAM-dependent methyltransferase n=2 Tax=Streptomyces candidus TaxID=67283 RepID=A0A7X0HKI4_9ACTN|nr:SAM-dependent methyltransferase [Streptomyces candidus]